MARHKARGKILNHPAVLLVEDEALVRLTQVHILREAEFWVAEAQDADEVFDMLRTRPDIALVLIDVDMPGSMNGFEFARLVRQRGPEVGVLVISGKATPIPGDLPANTTSITKPVRPETLIEVLRRALAARPETARTPTSPAG